jgi:Uma2 family endonuclease
MSDMAIAYERHRISVDEYHRMADAGVFPPDARIELLDGDLIETVVTMHPPHAACIVGLVELLTMRLVPFACVRSQVPVILGDYSEPEPDCAIVRRDPRRYIDRHPQVADIFFLIEVADSSRDEDRRMKIPLYGRCGVAETWLVDLVDDVVLIHRDPAPDGYGVVTIARRGETVAPLAFPDVAIPVDDILPPR